MNIRVQAVAIAATIILASAAPSFGDASCTAAFQQLAPTCSGETGTSDPNNTGECNGRRPKAQSWISEMSSGDDCSRDVQKSAFAVVKETWVLLTEDHCTWKVTSAFTASYKSVGYAEFDDTWDCDDANAWAKGRITNLQHGAAPGAGSYSEDGIYVEASGSGSSDSKTYTITSAFHTSQCVASGTHFYGESKVHTSAWVRSEAQASGGTDQLTDMVAQLSTKLCIAGQGGGD